jgi:apolipoprotein N-acyltransferase
MTIMLATRIAITLIAAATLSFLAPPVNIHWLHWVAYLPMFWVLREDTPRENRWLGYLYGVVGVALIFRWFVDTIILFSNLSPVIAWTALLLFGLVFGLPYIVLWSNVHPLRKKLGIWWIVAIPALQVFIEYLSMYVLIFPYQHGVSQYRTPYVWQLASVTGVWGISFLLFFVNATLAEAMYRHREGRRTPWKAFVITGSVVAVVFGFGAWRHGVIEAKLSNAPIIQWQQIQTKNGMKERQKMTRHQAFAYWYDATNAIPPGSVDLVVWPESACPYNLNEGTTAKKLNSLATKGQFDLVVGGGSRERRREEDGQSTVTAFNSVYFFRKDGEVSGRYDKMVPLPFGEYIPLSDTFPILREWIRGPGNFGAGKEAVMFDGTFGNYASPICYEAILSYVASRWLNPDLFLNVTNDSWFGDTAAPHQHAMLAAIRSMELGVPTVRTAYTGVSMLVEPHGKIHHETTPFTDVSRVVPIRNASVETVYSKFGDWFVHLCSLFLGMTFLILPWLRKK